MPTISPRTVDFTFLLIAPASKIQATVLGDPASHNADQDSPKFTRIIRETIDKILQQCFLSTSEDHVEMEDLEVDENGNLTFDPAYTIKQPLKKYTGGDTSITEIDLTYDTINCTFDITGWDGSQAPPLKYINSDHDDPRLIKEIFFRIIGLKNPGPLKVTTVNSFIQLTPPSGP